MSENFTVQYCSNWDGGGQEFDTARAAILAVHPDANVIGRRVDKYPIEVKIFDGEKKLLWSSDQRSLFRKNASRRSQSIEEIKRVVSGK